MRHIGFLIALVLVPPSAVPGVDSPPPSLGPWPDFGPHFGLATHLELDSIGTELSDAFDDALGDFHFVEDGAPAEFAFDAGHLLWMRDYTPLYVHGPAGPLMLTPLLEQAVRRKFRGGVTPARAGARSPAGEVLLRTRPLPIVLEGGNLVSTGRWAFLTEAVYQDNNRELDLEDAEDELLFEANYQRRSAEEVDLILSEALALPRDRIMVLPTMPLEATGHVNLFVMALGPDTVMVPRLSAEAIATSVDDEGALAAEETASFLDGVAELLAERGLRVVRWSMLPPQRWESVQTDDAEDVDAVFLSPANGVLYNGPGGRHAIMPRFNARRLLSPPLRRLQRQYEQEWAEVLEFEYGYELTFIEATELSRYFGLLRCVTAPLPFAPHPLPSTP